MQQTIELAHTKPGLGLPFAPALKVGIVWSHGGGGSNPTHNEYLIYICIVLTYRS